MSLYIGRMTTDLQPTGSESVAEKWLFHKLNYASEVVNSAMETRDFERASSAAYHFFLNDLCDVFIVCPTDYPINLADRCRKLQNHCSNPTSLQQNRSLLKTPSTHVSRVD